MGGIGVEILVGKRFVAADATRLGKRSVHVMEAAGAGAFVKVVHVLGDQVKALPKLLLDRGQGMVCGVRLGSAGVVAAHGIEVPHERGIGGPGLRCGDLLHTKAVPQAAGATKGGQAAFRGDTGAGEDEKTAGWGKRKGHSPSMRCRAASVSRGRRAALSTAG
jgi:hypothetical protein